MLGSVDDALLARMLHALAGTATLSGETDLGELALEVGRVMVDAMALLDTANAATYGEPVATKVRLGVGSRPGILVTGHDLRDLEELLEPTAGTGVDVDTHCEMWAAHAYPRLAAYPQLVGNYGNAWWLQEGEFEAFGGPVLVTSNCVVPPRESYRQRLFTTGVAGFPGVAHVPDAPGGGPKDFSPLVELARRCRPPRPLDGGEVTGGFSHRFVGQHLGTVCDLVRRGRISRFVVMAGCDGRDGCREHFTRTALPPDAVILTAGCAEFRYIKQVHGEIEGLPRVLDTGQCNDCYSLVRIALALEALGVASVNDLPIEYDLAWYDQKAVGIVLGLAALGVRGLHMGPTLPAYLLTPAGQRFAARHEIRPTALSPSC